MGVVRVWSRRSGRVVVCLVAVPFIVLQLTAARYVSEDLTLERAKLRQIGALLEEYNEGNNCRFESRYGYPVLQLRSGCEGSRTTDPEQSFYRLGFQPSDVSAFLIWNRRLKHPSNWSELESPIPGDWYIYVRLSD